MTTSILIDWGGTIIRDGLLFNYIAEKSGNMKTKWESPSSWDNIRHLGDRNFFNDIKETFFLFGKEYSGAEEIISSLYGRLGKGSKSEIFLIYDNNPEVYKADDVTLTRWSFALNHRNIKFNGLYIDRDKIRVAKQIGASILVEDDPRIAVGCAMAGIKVILMIRKWNRFFNIDHLSYCIKKENLEKIKSNLIIVEDWFEAGVEIASIIDGSVV